MPISGTAADNHPIRVSAVALKCCAAGPAFAAEAENILESFRQKAHLEPMSVWLLAFFLMSGALSFAAGILLPLLVLEKLYFFSETPSLLQIVAGLWQNDDVLLAVLVAAFSLVFPLAKLFVLFLEAIGQFSRNGQASRAFRHMSMVGRWSMMDVLLVAIVIFAAKTSGFATATTQPGLWFYAYAALASAVSAALIRNSAQPVTT